MPLFVYRGLTDEQKATRLKNRMDMYIPPSKPCRGMVEPREGFFEAKMAEERAAYQAEIEAEIALDDSRWFCRGLTFPKDEPVELSERDRRFFKVKAYLEEVGAQPEPVPLSEEVTPTLPPEPAPVKKKKVIRKKKKKVTKKKVSK